MSDNLSRLIESGYKMIEVANKLLLACGRKEKKVYSHSRSAVSFFLRRSLELFESFLILVKERRIIDSAVLLRSLLDMGMTLGYIYSKDIDEAESEKRAHLYLIEGNRFQLKLLNSNIDEIRKTDTKIVERKAEIEGQIRDLEEDYKKQYGEEVKKYPSHIEERAKQSKYQILKKVYDQSYRILSSIEHHSFFFGQDYVDMDECEPIKKIDHLRLHPELKLTVNLMYFRSIFIEILSVFDKEFQLGWEKQVAELRALQDEEHPLLRD